MLAPTRRIATQRVLNEPATNVSGLLPQVLIHGCCITNRHACHRADLLHADRLNTPAPHFMPDGSHSFEGTLRQQLLCIHRCRFRPRTLGTARLLSLDPLANLLQLSNHIRHIARPELHVAGRWVLWRVAVVPVPAPQTYMLSDQATPHTLWHAGMPTKD